MGCNRASDSQGPIDLPVADQLLEEYRHHLADGTHGDVALHGKHSRDACLCQPRAECIEGLPGAVACTLTGGQHHQAGRILQLTDAIGQFCARGAADLAFFVFEEQPRLLAGINAMGNQVQHIVELAGCRTAAQCIDQAVERAPATPWQGVYRDIQHGCLGAGDLARRIHCPPTKTRPNLRGWLPLQGRAGRRAAATGWGASYG